MALQFNYAMANDANNSSLDTIPLAKAPPGWMTDFESNPGNQCNILLGFASTFMLATLLTTGIRVFTKVRILRSWSWDDITFAPAFLGTVGVFVLTTMFGIVSKVGSHVWNVPLGLVYSTTWTSENDCYDTLVPITMGFLKTTFFIYLYNMFYTYPSIRRTAITGVILTTLFYLAILIAMLSTWVPRPGEPLPLVLPEGKALMMNSIMFASSCGGLFLDLVIWTLPMVAIIRLQFSGRKTCGIGSIFFMGLVAILASCMSVAYRLKSNLNWNSDFLFIGMPTLLCTFIELSSGCIAASLPSIVVLYNYFRGNPVSEKYGSTLGNDNFPLAYAANDTANLTPDRARQQYLKRKTSVLSDGVATITEHMALPFSKHGGPSRKSSVTALPQLDADGSAVEMQRPRKSSSADELIVNASELADLDEQAQNMTAKSFEKFRARDIEPWERWEALKTWPPEPSNSQGPATRRYKMEFGD